MHIVTSMIEDAKRKTSTTTCTGSGKVLAHPTSNTPTHRWLRKRKKFELRASKDLDPVEDGGVWNPDPVIEIRAAETIQIALCDM